MIGADPGDLESLATTMDDGAITLDTAKLRLRASFQHARWHGADAQQARANFAGRQEPQLSSAADLLRETARQLRNQAQEQVRASAAEGGEGAAGGPGSQDKGSFYTLPAVNPAASTSLPDQDSFGDGKLSITEKISAKGPLGTIPGLNKGIDAEVGVSTTTTLEKSSKEDGDTYSVTSKVSVDGSASIDLKRWGIKGSVTSGAEVSYQLTVPHGVDPLSINPNDPASWPPGTSLKLAANQVSGYGMAVTYEGVSAENNLGSSHGTSRIVTRNADGTVTVMQGPTEAVNQSFKLGIGIDEVKLSMGASESLSGGEYHSVTFDPATAEGAAALDRSAYSGTLPTADAPGLKDVVQVSNVQYSHKLETTGKILGFQWTDSSDPTTHSYVTTTRGDGSIERTITLRSPSEPDLVVTRNWDSTGQVEPEKTLYEYRQDNISDNDAQVLNNKKYSGIDSGGGFKAGDDVSISFTQQQMDDYHAAAMAEYARDDRDTGIGAYGRIAGLGGMDENPDLFPVNLQKAGEDSLIEQIWRFNTSDSTSKPLAFPGTVDKQ